MSGTGMAAPGASGGFGMRDHSVAHRAATPLELLFDLCFVVAVAFLAEGLHHGIVEGHPWESAATYALLFVPIWWAWMSYTWFATAFDTDDTTHRVLTLLQMAGVLAVTATIHLAEKGTLAPFALAYALMRVPLLVQWLRAARRDSRHRAFCYTYAGGTAIAQSLWIVGALIGGGAALAFFAAAVVVDLATPVLAVRTTPDRVFHAGHIAERYGLFALIVLGETLLAVSIALQWAIEGAGALGSTVVVVSSALAVAFGMWWIYFDALGRNGLERNRQAAFTWGYGHYLLYASFAAVGAGVQAQVELLAEGHDGALASASVAVPVAASLAAVGWLQSSANRRLRRAIPLFAGAVACALVAGFASPWLSAAVANIAVALIVAVVVIAVASTRKATAPPESVVAVR